MLKYIHTCTYICQNSLAGYANVFQANVDASGGTVIDVLHIASFTSLI